MRKCSSGLWSIGTGWEDIILPGIKDPHNCTHPQNIQRSERFHKLGKIERAFSFYDKVRWKWDDVYLLRCLLTIYFPSLCSPPLSLYLRTTAIAPCRYTWTLLLTVFGDALGDWDPVNLERHCEAMIIQRTRWTWRPRPLKFGDLLGGWDRVNSEMNLKAVIERVWRCTWKPRSSGLRDALGSRDRAS